MTALAVSTKRFTTDKPHLIDDYVLKRIDFKARQLAIKFQLPDDRRDELAQEMVVELLNAADRFDHNGTAIWHTYASRVLDLTVIKLIQNDSRARQRQGSAPMSLSHTLNGGLSNADFSAPDVGLARLELKLDVEVVLARMPRRLRKVCVLLMQLSPAEAARSLGIHRNSIYRIIAQIREHFMQPEFGFADFSAANFPAVRV